MKIQLTYPRHRLLQFTAFLAMFSTVTAYATANEGGFEIDPDKPLKVLIYTEGLQVAVDENDAYYYLQDAIKDIFVEENGYNGKITFHRWFAKTDPEEEQILKISLVEWRRNLESSISTRFFASFESYTGKTELGVIAGHADGTFTLSSSLETLDFLESLDEGVQGLYSKLKPHILLR